MRAVLADGLRSVVHAIRNGSRRARNRVQSDLAWLTSTDRGSLFSFEVICDALDLDADRLRSRILSAVPAPVVVTAPAASRAMRGAAGPLVRRPVTRAA